MDRRVREYLEKFESANKEVSATEDKLNIHFLEVEKKINEIKKASEMEIAPVLEELAETKAKRKRYNDLLKGKLVVNAKDLLKRLDYYANLDYLDNARMFIDFQVLQGFLSKNELREKIKANDKALRNALRITIRNDKEGYDHKFYIYKSVPLDENIQFSDGSSIYDNIIITKFINNFNEKCTRITLTENGEKNLMLSFTPEELVNSKYVLRPATLLRKSVLSVLENCQKPTM